MQVSDVIQTRLKETRARRRELELKLISNPDFQEWVATCETIAELEKLELVTGAQSYLIVPIGPAVSIQV